MKKMWNNLNIATKLILVFSMVSVMPLLVMSFVLYHISANSLESAMEETASIFSSQIASDMNGFISDYDALTKSLLVNEGLMDRLDTEIPISQRIENKLFYRELVMRLMTMESEIQSVTIMNEEGGYFQYDRTGRSLSYEELLRQDWFLKEQENSEVLFLTPLHDCSYYDRNRDQIGSRICIFQNTAFIKIDLFHISRKTNNSDHSIASRYTFPDGLMEYCALTDHIFNF